MKKDKRLKSYLPIGWVKTTLKNICEFEYGKALKQTNRNEFGKYPVYGSNGIVGKHDTFLVPGPCIIVGRKGAAGAVHYSLSACWPIDTTYFVKKMENLNIKFLFYQLTHLNLLSLEKSTAIPGLNRNDAYEMSFHLPPFNEQNRIVLKLEELLSELEKGKEQLQTALEQLKVYRQSILKDAFEGRLTDEWRGKQKELKTPDELVNEISEYRRKQYEKQLKEYKAGKTQVKPKKPKDIAILKGLTNPKIQWALSRLGDIVETTSGGTPSRNNLGYYSGKIPWVKSGELKYNTILTTEESITEDAIKRSSAKLFPKGTLLVALYGATVGKLAFLGMEAATNQAVCGIFQEPYYDLNFLYYFLMLKRPDLVDQSTGGAQPNISQTILNNLPIPLCSLEEQKAVVCQIDHLFSLNDALENTLTKNIAQSDTLKESLLQKAFEGKLVDQDPSDEPASSLLKRIKEEREAFLQAELERKKKDKPIYNKINKMAEELKSILAILQECNAPVASKTLWKSSVHKDDIDEFYAELKKHIEKGEVIELPREGKESFLQLKEAQ
jgi:type I restriction enzyme, S subunit